MNKRTYSYLALGDSYTIGEQVSLFESFPYQVVRLLRDEGIPCYAPEIIAKTGWTTEELDDQLKKTALNSYYDFITLLIGVNNQYRGKEVQQYAEDFKKILLKAVSLTNEIPSHVFVLSIPDWSVTPFAAGRNRDQISRAIASYNESNKATALESGVCYIDITTGYLDTAVDPSFLAPDQLHPSAKEYGRWALLLVEEIKKQID
jgi:lysophospholipase L1-like esterase